MSRQILYITILLVLLQSCGSAPPAIRSEPDLLDTRDILPRIGNGKEIVITGKVRLDLPKYRVKGSCRIFYDGNARLQVDFLHSSLFGSYREDATLYIDEEQIIINDHERDVIWESERSLDVLERHFGFSIFSGDIMTLLLFSEPDLENKDVAADGDDWKVTGKWHGREVVIKGEKGKGPVEIVLCGSDGTPCYTAKYKYKRWNGTVWYPEKIVFEQKYGPTRFSLDVSTFATDVMREAGDN